MQQPEWPGLRSQKFESGRRHVVMQDELNRELFSENVIQPQGLKTYEPLGTVEAKFKSCLKVFPEVYRATSKQINLLGKKFIEPPEQVERVRPEKSHIVGSQRSSQQYESRGVKNFKQANRSCQQEYSLEMQVAKKARILGLQAKRNGLGIASLGDKSYKYPEYSVNFYHAGGLIPGSTGFRGKADGASQSVSKTGSVFTKPMWNLKVKMDEEMEEKRVINSIDDWEQTILKEANPKWNDPDTFFERMEKEKEVKKEVKKAGKK